MCDNLEKNLSILFPIVYKNFLDNIAYINSKVFPDYEKFFNVGFVKIANLIISQVIFDILYDKYLI